MTVTKITRHQSAQNLKDLQSEMVQMRSFLIGLAGKDSEGEYQPVFVERVLRIAAQEPTEKFTTSADFLRQLY